MKNFVPVLFACGCLLTSCGKNDDASRLAQLESRVEALESKLAEHTLSTKDVVVERALVTPEPVAKLIPTVKPEITRPIPINETEVLVYGRVFQVLDNGVILHNCSLFYPNEDDAITSAAFGIRKKLAVHVVEVGEKFEDVWYGGKLPGNLFVYLNNLSEVYEENIIGPIRVQYTGSFEYDSVLGSKAKIRSFILAKPYYRFSN